MLQRLETVLKKQNWYQLEDCTIDSLMRLECDYISCEGCQYTLCDINNEDTICEIELIDDLSSLK